MVILLKQRRSRDQESSTVFRLCLTVLRDPAHQLPVSRRVYKGPVRDGVALPTLGTIEIRESKRQSSY